MIAGNKRQRLRNLWWNSAYPYCLIVSIFVFLLTTKLFYNQLVAADDYASDITAHLSSALAGKAYSITAVFLRLSYNALGNLGVAMFLGLVSAMTMWAAAGLIRTLIKLRDPSRVTDLSHLFLGAAPAIFLCSLYLPGIYGLLYSHGGKITDFTQPWHNSTYLLMRLFSLPVFALYFRIEKDYLRKISMRQLAGFFVALVLVNAAKPNFFIAFAPAMLCFLIYDFIKTHAKGTAQIIQFGLPVLLSASVLIYQYKVLYSGESGASSGIVVSLVPLKNYLAAGFFFPYLLAGSSFVLIVTLLVILRKQFSRRLSFGWLVYLFSFVERWLLFETGLRARHGNLTWGTKDTAFLLTLMCLDALLELRRQDKISFNMFLALVSLYGLMVFCGLVYFALLFHGVNYLN